MGNQVIEWAQMGRLTNACISGSFLLKVLLLWRITLWDQEGEGIHRSLTIQYALNPLDINRELPAQPSLFTENTSWFLWRIDAVGERQLPHSSG